MCVTKKKTEEEEEMGNRKNDFVIHRISYYKSQLCRIPVSVDEQHM